VVVEDASPPPLLGVQVFALPEQEAVAEPRDLHGDAGVLPLSLRRHSDSRELIPFHSPPPVLSHLLNPFAVGDEDFSPYESFLTPSFPSPRSPVFSPTSSAAPTTVATEQSASASFSSRRSSSAELSSRCTRSGSGVVDGESPRRALLGLRRLGRSTSSVGLR